MQDKIQEIIGLVTQHAYIYYSAAIGGCRDSDDVKESECVIESKLRELVRESLSDEQMETLIEKHAPPIHPDFSEDDDFEELVRAIEAAHNITNASGVE